MAVNSIHANLTKEDIIAELRLSLSVDFEKKKCMVIVEGEDDILFLKGKLDSSAELYESFSGKSGVEEIVEYFSEPRVIGICDADYSNSRKKYLFCYDYCCLEMMIISSDSAFLPFVNTYYFGPLSPEELRLHILKNLGQISQYRKYSAENNLGINFKGLSFSNALNRSTLNIDYNSIQKQLRQRNPDIDDEVLTSVFENATEDKLEIPLVEYYKITQGHDFLFCFQEITNTTRFQRKNFSGSLELFRALNCAYRYEDFWGSELFSSVQEHCTNNNLIVWAK